MIDMGEMDPKFKYVTLSLDGTHNLIQKLKKSQLEALRSYKLKDNAYNVLVNVCILDVSKTL